LTKKLLIIATVIFFLIIGIILFITINNNSFTTNNIPFTQKVSIGKNIFKVGYAKTITEREIGLMNVKEMPKENGMLFIFDTPVEQTFWMKNTYIPLDIIFINEKLEIISISANAKPLDIGIIYSSNGKAKYVLEINGGLSDSLGIIIGDKHNFQE